MDYREDGSGVLPQDAGEFYSQELGKTEGEYSWFGRNYSVELRKRGNRGVLVDIKKDGDRIHWDRFTWKSADNSSLEERLEDLGDTVARKDPDLMHLDSESIKYSGPRIPRQV